MNDNDLSKMKNISEDISEDLIEALYAVDSNPELLSQITNSSSSINNVKNVMDSAKKIFFDNFFIEYKDIRNNIATLNSSKLNEFNPLLYPLYNQIQTSSVSNFTSLIFLSSVMGIVTVMRHNISKRKLQTDKKSIIDKDEKSVPINMIAKENNDNIKKSYSDKIEIITNNNAELIDYTPNLFDKPKCYNFSVVNWLLNRE